jgi:glucan phosphoethanolaminetransferase (alkaline phosphatase superfamily)
MTELLNTLQSLDQDQAVVALFAGVLIFASVAIVLCAVLRSLGKWGVVAFCFAGAAVCIALMVR